VKLFNFIDLGIFVQYIIWFGVLRLIYYLFGIYDIFRYVKSASDVLSPAPRKVLSARPK